MVICMVVDSDLLVVDSDLLVVDGDLLVVTGGSLALMVAFYVLGNSSSRFLPDFIFIWLMALIVRDPVTNMFWFYLKKKSGFTKYTPGVYPAYTWCILPKIYRIGYELFGAIKLGKKLRLFLLENLPPISGARRCTLPMPSD